MELFIILFVLMCITPVGLKAVRTAIPALQSEVRTRKAIGRIQKSKLALETARAAHKDAYMVRHNAHISELADFDRQILEIERPAIRKMVERRTIEASTGFTSTDKSFWLQEKQLLLRDYEHISNLCRGQEITALDLDLLQGIADRMDEVRKQLDYINAKEQEEEQKEREALKAPAELFDFLETVNDPDVDIVRQMKATQRFVGLQRTEDIYYGRITSDQLLDMAQKKVDSYLKLPNFQDRMQREALRRVNNSDNPDRLLELWGVSENFNNWVKNMDKHPDNY